MQSVYQIAPDMARLDTYLVENQIKSLDTA
jgi:hypothetical protein